MKKIVGILLIVLLLLSGCGVAQEEYDSVVAERDAAQAQVSELASSLEEAEAELEATKTENQALEQANAKLKRFAFYKTVLCSKEPEDGEPKAQPDNTFKTSDTVWVYINYIGFKYTLAAQQFRLSLTTSMKILDVEGKVVDSISWDWNPREEEGWWFVWSCEPFGPFDAGNYTVEVEVIDNNSGETITWEEEFQVVSS